MSSALLPPRLKSLSAVTDLWLDTSHSWRRKAREALEVSTGYSPLLIDEALDNVFQELTFPALESFFQNSISPVSEPRTVLHIAAGNVFTAWLHGAVITLLMGHRCWIKPSSLEPVFAALWHRSLQEIDADLAETVRVVPWDETLLQRVDAVVAYGSDDTLARLSALSAGKPFIGYGHKWSFGIVFAEAQRSAEWPAWREKIQRDGRAFALQGCLSPQQIFVEDSENSANGVSFSSGVAPKVTGFRSLSDFRDHLPGDEKALSCIGVAGSASAIESVRKFFGASPSLRICEFGSMQRPPLTWRNGGISLTETLSFR